VVAAGEPTWTESDTELALEWQSEKRLRCEGCGHHLDETLAEDGRRSYEPQHVTCWACAAIELRRATMIEEERDMSGVRIYATRRQGDG
jgi:hypothetical protein